jgi:coenzyme PQQ precursor peptide PqqA
LPSGIANRGAMAEHRLPLTMKEEQNMWRKPKMIEICTGAEINSYISAGK